MHEAEVPDERALRVRGGQPARVDGYFGAARAFAAALPVVAAGHRAAPVCALAPDRACASNRPLRTRLERGRSRAP